MQSTTQRGVPESSDAAPVFVTPKGGVGLAGEVWSIGSERSEKIGMILPHIHAFLSVRRKGGAVILMTWFTLLLLHIFADTLAIIVLRMFLSDKSDRFVLLFE
ncbi:hypothetical protein P692DRAFT_201267859 [Suillus brevipes Sb2]|nr:hypothetical protein P692DRAFT_201267859 [Suillus brevipes Sb2]